MTFYDTPIEKNGEYWLYWLEQLINLLKKKISNYMKFWKIFLMGQDYPQHAMCQYSFAAYLQVANIQ